MMSERENVRNETDRVIAYVYALANGTVAVFDQRGRQMPEYKGRADEVMERIVAKAPASAFFESW